jgi:aspartokinase-like uncharacterized kinase
VIVPGGGPFADAVREAQAHWRFDDRAAHVMALLAMAQYGVMLAALPPNLFATTDVRLLRSKAEAGLSAIWLPDHALIRECGIPASWDFTSDSFAVWLAGQLGLVDLLLVKSRDCPAVTRSADDLAADGLVDPGLPTVAGDAGLNIWLSGPLEHGGLSGKFAEPARYFTKIA